MGFGQVSRHVLAVFCCFCCFAANYQPESPWIGPIPQSGRGAKPKKQQTRLCSCFGVQVSNGDAHTIKMRFYQSN
jgi:hypothetical protein